jgi:hypothetical protein
MACVMSSPYTLPHDPVSVLEISASVPEPEPTSRTTSPSRIAPAAKG